MTLKKARFNQECTVAIPGNNYLSKIIIEHDSIPLTATNQLCQGGHLTR